MESYGFGFLVLVLFARRKIYEHLRNRHYNDRGRGFRLWILGFRFWVHPDPKGDLVKSE
jgi:hypothetical protein